MIRFRRRPNGRYRLALTLSFDRRQGRMALAFAVSVLFHVLLFSFGPHRPPPPLDFKNPGPLDVTIVEPTPPSVPHEEVATATPSPVPPAPRPVPPQRIARAHPTPAPRVVVPTPQPEPVPAPVPTPAPPAVDMLAMINARRQRREAQ